MAKAMKHQAVSIKFGGKIDCMLDMSDPGTGKTFTQIMLYLKRRKKGECLMVIAPKSLLEPAWENDIRKFAPELVVSVANAENRQAAFDVDADVYVTNTDAVKWLAAKPKGFFDKFNHIVVDESTAFKHITSQRSKALGKIKKYFKYRSALTGTPTSNTITDIWNQINFLDDGKRLGHSFFAFRNAVCIPKQVGSKATMVQWIDKDGAEEVTFSLVADITIRHKFEDCIDIPENLQYSLPYKLGAKQLRAYKEMALTQIAALGDMKAITAINAAAVTTKLLQIASGAVYEHTGKYHLVDTGRYELVLDLVEERKHSIVFFLWQHQRDYLIAEATKRKLKFCVYDSSASAAVRNQMIKDYQNGFYQVFFAHPQSAAHGLTLTRATATIWPSPTYNLEHFVQGNKRAFRNGQKNKTETIVIIAPDTLEEKVYEKLQAKNMRMMNLLDLFT
jgi:SNF2 family DNA or RNA helicase